jgi:hypothetical protein
MSDEWGGYANGQIPEKAMIRVQSSYFKPDVAYALADAIAECKKAGINVVINEGYRPLGVPGDQFVHDAAKTSTGRGGQWYEWGRMKRGETPAAAYPGTSLHGWAKAADVNPGRDRVAGIFNKHGFIFDISSESWHAHFIGSTPTGWKWMVPSSALQKAIQTQLKRLGAYSGATDGVWGTQSIKGIQKLAGSVPDGIPGQNTVRAVQEFARKYGRAQSPVDMILNEAWWSHFNAGLETR